MEKNLEILYHYFLYSVHNKIKENKNYHSVITVLKFNCKIVITEAKSISLAHMNMTAPLLLVCTATSLNSG